MALSMTVTESIEHPASAPMRLHAPSTSPYDMFRIDGEMLARSGKVVDDSGGAFVEYLIPVDKGKRVVLVARSGSIGMAKLEQWSLEMTSRLPHALFMRPSRTFEVPPPRHAPEGAWHRHAAIFEYGGQDCFRCCIAIKDRCKRKQFARAAFTFLVQAITAAFSTNEPGAVADIKPENVLFSGSLDADEEFEWTQFKMVDFGLIRGTPGGSPSYIHPKRRIIDAPTKRDALFAAFVFYISVALCTDPPRSHPPGKWNRTLRAYSDVLSDDPQDEINLAFDAYETLLAAEHGDITFK